MLTNIQRIATNIDITRWKNAISFAYTRIFDLTFECFFSFPFEYSIAPRFEIYQFKQQQQ